jgi:hypothetical protein
MNYTSEDIKKLVKYIYTKHFKLLKKYEKKNGKN